MFVIAEKYHVISTLGGGGMGAVYEALHSGTGRRVAVKMLRQEISSNSRARERFVREARIAGSLTSAHVAEILDAGTDDVSGLPFLVMELLEGPNLRDLIQERGHLPIGLVLVIAAHVASGLEEAHQAGVIHRDIKPANIVLCSSRSGDLVAKIVDFGVAKALEEEERALTRTGDVVGSLRYMSPEQLSGERATAASDLWSLGAVMYEALAGVGPSGNAEALAAIVQKVCLEEIRPLTSVPREVAAIVHRALARDPQKRFPSARAMHDAIRMLLPRGLQVPAAVIGDGSQIPVSARSPGTLLDWQNKRWMMAFGAGATLTVATALIARAQSTRKDVPIVETAPLAATPLVVAASNTPAPIAQTVELDTTAEAPARPSPSSSIVRPIAAPAKPRPTKARDPLDHM